MMTVEMTDEAVADFLPACFVCSCCILPAAAYFIGIHIYFVLEVYNSGGLQGFLTHQTGGVLGGIGDEQVICFYTVAAMNGILLLCLARIVTVSADKNDMKFDLFSGEEEVLGCPTLVILAILSCVEIVLRLVGCQCPPWMPLMANAIMLLMLLAYTCVQFSKAARGPRVKALLWGLVFTLIAVAFSIAGIVFARKDQDLWREAAFRQDMHHDDIAESVKNQEVLQTKRYTEFVLVFFPLGFEFLILGAALLVAIAVGCSIIVNNAGCCVWALENCCSCRSLASKEGSRTSSQPEKSPGHPVPTVMHDHDQVAQIVNTSVHKHEEAKQTASTPECALASLEAGLKMASWPLSTFPSRQIECVISASYTPHNSESL